jgi:hypothetical protein
MGTIFKGNESNREQEISRLKENLAGANKKLASLEEKMCSMKLNAIAILS